MHFLSGCISSAQFAMSAKILKQYVDDDNLTSSPGLDYEISQDPMTGEIIRKWANQDPDVAIGVVDIKTSCYVEGYSKADSFRSKIAERYEYGQRLIVHFPARTSLAVSDRVSDIMDSSNRYVFVEDIVENGKNIPTVYNVVDVGKNFDFSGREIETIATLERAGVQGA